MLKRRVTNYHDVFHVEVERDGWGGITITFMGTSNNPDENKHAVVHLKWSSVALMFHHVWRIWRLHKQEVEGNEKTMRGDL